MTKKRIHWVLITLLIATGLTVAAHFWTKPASLQEPLLYVARLANDKGPPVIVGTDGADLYFNSLFADPNIQASGLGLTVVSHGWMEKDDWYEDLALALRAHTQEPWLFAWYDWQTQSKHVNPTKVARLAKNQLGPNLGQMICDAKIPITHVHLIGHSAGSWLINEAAKVIARKQKIPIHLTFLDAYIPAGWHDEELGNLDLDANSIPSVWSDHYLTHDHTLAFTYHKLKHAHNVNLTSIAHGMNRHRFPFYWYHATVTGQYPREAYNDLPVINRIGDTRYGFPLTREAGESNWQQALTLPMGNTPLDMEPTD